MKKLTAILLALLLLLTSAALAEATAATAANMAFENVVVEVNGESAAVEGLVLTVGLDATGDPTMLLAVENGTELLSLAAAKVVDGKLMITLTGADATYTADAATLGGAQAEQALSQFANLRDAIPQFDQLVLPPFPGVNIPKLDTTAMLRAYATGTEGDTTTFAISYEQVMGWLDMVKMYADLFGSQLASIPNMPSLDQITGMIDQLKESQTGIAIDGTIADQGDAQVTTFNILPVEGGVTAEEPAMALTFTTAENSDTLVLGDPSGSATLASLELESDPATPSLELAMDLMGMANFDIALFPEDGLQKLAVTAQASEQELDMDLAYGESDGRDLVNLGFSATGASLSLQFDTAKDESGVRTGTVKLDALNRDQTVTMSGDVTMWLDTAAPVEIEWPANELPLSELTSETAQAALAPVMEYLQTLEPAA